MTDQKTLAEATVRHFLDNPEYASELKVAFARASSMRLVPVPVYSRAPAMALPTEAPRLWADAPAGMTATQFVREVYAPWIEAGVMTLKAIGECDPALSRAYSNRAHRHPDEAVALVRAERADMIADPQVAIDRVRERTRIGMAKWRAARRNDGVPEAEAAQTPKHAFGTAASAAETSQPVPDVAPRLWNERDKKMEKNPAEFIRTVYASCMANLGQHHLLTLDRSLYRRYVDWKHEPKELVDGKTRPCDMPVEFGVAIRLSDEERGRRARAQSIASSAKKRAQRNTGSSPPSLDP